MTAKASHSKTVPLRVGLTGGIASGKSSVAEMFAELGAAIIDTDLIARDVVQPGMPALDRIRRQFGATVLHEDGSLNRAAMRQLVFSDDAKRRELEGILHPLIQQETLRQSEASAHPYQIIVVPLLTRSPLVHFVDRILVVDCDEETQVSRLIARDRESGQQARRILAAQASREDRLAIADDVIRNDQDLADTRRQVEDLHRTYMHLSQNEDSGSA